MVQVRANATLIGWLRPATIVLAAALFAACSAAPLTSEGPLNSLAAATSDTPGAPSAAAGLIPSCQELHSIEAAPELYRPGAKEVKGDRLLMAIMDWARGKPSFQELWIDRDRHDGWITLAFSRDALLRQLELAVEFPDVAVVAVEVPWTMAELEALQQRVITDFRPGGPLVSSGIQPQHGVVTIGVTVLFPEVVAEVESKFGGQRVCIEGADPADVPPDGAQPQAGEGWRLLTDQDETGEPYRTGIAADTDAYAALWAEVGLKGDPPPVNFETEVVVWFGAVHGSSCPRLRLDDVVVNVERALLHSVITRWEFGACTADAIGHAYVVAVERAMLAPGGFTIQLQAEDPPAGVIDQERTVVTENLSIPGSTISSS
jgi:hypothetical protein